MVADTAQHGSCSEERAAAETPLGNNMSRQRCPWHGGAHCTHTHIYTCLQTHKRVQQRCLGDVCSVWKAVQSDNYYQDYYCLSGPQRNLCPIGYMINLWANYCSASSEAFFLNCTAVSLIEYQNLEQAHHFYESGFTYSPSLLQNELSYLLTHWQPSVYSQCKGPTPASLMLHWQLMVHKWIT